MNNQVFTNIGRYKGALVALKYINKVTLVVTKEIIDEINNVSRYFVLSLKKNMLGVSNHTLE